MSRRAPGRAAEMRVGRLHDHRSERRPVDVHVMRGHRQQHRLDLAVLAQEVDAELAGGVPCSSRSIALPMSCRNAARTATCALSPSSVAMMPARNATSFEWFSTFWP